MINIYEVADKADFIVNGYAFTATENNWFRVLNLNNTNSAAVIDEKGRMIETTMDDSELDIITEIYSKKMTDKG